MLLFYIDRTSTLNPRDFCEQYKSHAPGSSSSKPINLDPVIKPYNMTDRYNYVGSEQTSTSTYTSDEIPIYKFMLTKEEEEERREHNLDIRIHRR